MSAPAGNGPVVYFGTFISTPTPHELRIAHATAIGVDANGKIAFVERDTTLDKVLGTLKAQGWSPDTRVVSGDSVSQKHNATSFFFPGFLDTHTHASQYPNVGIFGSSTLLDWLETYTFPLESSFSSVARAQAVYNRVVSRSLSHGTTAAAYYATVHVPATNLLADICHARGQRALIGRVCMDRMSPASYQDESPETAIRDTQLCIDHIQSIDPNGDIVRPVITPRFAPSCTDDCLRRLGQLHKETGCWAQTHISENLNEVKLVKELFPSAKDYASVYDDFGLLTDKMILAHAVHLTPGEVDLIKKRRTKISHCPASNSCLTSGAIRVKKLMRDGVDVSLGTDMSGGFSPSILEMVRQALLVSRHVAMTEGDDAKLSIEEALWLGTKGGAISMGLEHKVGAFEIGMEFDAQMICMEHVEEESDSQKPSSQLSRGPVDIFGWESWEDRVAKWVYGADDRNVVAVWVKGRLVHQTAHFQL